MTSQKEVTGLNMKDLHSLITDLKKQKDEFDEQMNKNAQELSLINDQIQKYFDGETTTNINIDKLSAERSNVSKEQNNGFGKKKE